MGCRHSRYVEGDETRVESIHYKQRRSTKLKRSGRSRKKSAASAGGSSNSKHKSSVSSGASGHRNSGVMSEEEGQWEGTGGAQIEAERPSRTPSLERAPAALAGEQAEEFDSIANGKRHKKNKKGKKVKVKNGNKKREKEREKEQRRAQQLFGPGHEQAARNALSLSVSSPAADSSSALETGGQGSASLPARLLAHYKRAFPVWQAADYHFRQDGRGLTLSTLSGASLTCQCGKGLASACGGDGGGRSGSSKPCSGGEGGSVTTNSSQQQPAASAVGTSGRIQCRRCSLAAAKRAGLLPNNNNGSVDGGSAAAAAADDGAGGGGGGGGGGGAGGDNGAAASGAAPPDFGGKLQNNIDAIANFLVLAALDLSAPASSVLIQNRKNAWIQLAGHPGAFAPAGPNTIWKKRISKENYETLAYTALKEFSQASYITPIFYREVEYNGEFFIEMEDLLHHFNDPSIMDIKMGTRTFLEGEVKNPTLRTDLYEKMIKVDPHAPTDEERDQTAITKLRYMQFRERESSTASQGFRIEAIRMTGEPPNTNLKKVKTKEEVSHFITKFISGHEVVIPVLHRRLRDIREKFESISFFKSHEVIGSSLLIMYDRDNNAGVWMIDFAKTIPLQDLTVDHRSPWELGNHEDGYLFGIDRLIEIFSDLEEKLSEQEESSSLRDEQPSS